MTNVRQLRPESPRAKPLDRPLVPPWNAEVLAGLGRVQLQKLRENAHKDGPGGWKYRPLPVLLSQLRAELAELEEAVEFWEAAESAQSVIPVFERELRAVAVGREAADVANYCAFIGSVVGGFGR